MNTFILMSFVVLAIATVIAHLGAWLMGTSSQLDADAQRLLSNFYRATMVCVGILATIGSLLEVLR